MLVNQILRLLIASSLLLSSQVFSAQVRVDVSGVLDVIVLGSFTSNAFSSSFLYETDTSLSSVMTIDAPNDVGYIFDAPYFGSAVVGNPLMPTYDVNYQGVEVGVANNINVAIDDFPGVPAGIYDGFGLQSTSPGAVLDRDGVLSTGIQIGLLFFTNTNFFSDVNTIPDAPPNAMTDIGQFFVFDFTNDEINRAAIGNINSLTVTAVPIPAALMLFVSGLLVLFGVRKRI
ncbi:MAG: hypothetical protein R8G33_07060 [Gammaproteobacteria bacterium]|nr:hypothetical protein [Gammaproteobacteria bacterium]